MRDDSEAIDTSKKACEDLCWDFLDFHESTYSNSSWSDLSKEATAFAPESLSRAILSADVVKYIAKSIRGEHEYKANLEILTDKIYYVLEQGLNDAIPGWNDARQAEFQKYIKSQKRAGRRTKRVAPTAPQSVIVADNQANLEEGTRAENELAKNAS